MYKLEMELSGRQYPQLIPTQCTQQGLWLPEPWSCPGEKGWSCPCKALPCRDAWWRGWCTSQGPGLEGTGTSCGAQLSQWPEPAPKCLLAPWPGRHGCVTWVGHCVQASVSPAGPSENPADTAEALDRASGGRAAFQEGLGHQGQGHSGLIGGHGRSGGRRQWGARADTQTQGLQVRSVSQPPGSRISLPCWGLARVALRGLSSPWHGFP